MAQLGLFVAPGKCRAVYNGHKRVHGLKFQSVALPNGLTANLFGPVQRQKHDASVLDESGLLNELERHAFSPTGQALCIYGDPAYPHRVHLQRPFQYGLLTQQMQNFNGSIVRVRFAPQLSGFLETSLIILNF